MRLADLDPCWVGAGGDDITDSQGRPVPGRSGIGVAFNCPCGCDRACFVAFSNPLDDGPHHASPGQPTWQRTGDTFETLTLAPSILRTGPESCGWHGWIRNGEVVHA